MTPEQAIYWLQGFAELHPEPPSAAQWQSIREHVADGSVETAPLDIGKRLPRDDWSSAIGGYLVRYADGYTSWSPASAFEDGYTEVSLDPRDGALPVAGYKPQTGEKVDLVNGFKADEERVMRKLDALKETDWVDGRWLATGRTGLETAFMAINRAVFQPGRVTLPEDGGSATV